MEEVLRHCFFDFSPRLCSANSEGSRWLVDQIQRFQHYLMQAGLMQASENLKADADTLLLSLKHACLHVKRQSAGQ